MNSSARKYDFRCINPWNFDLTLLTRKIEILRIWVHRNNCLWMVSATSKTCRCKSDIINVILLLSYISGKTRRCLRNRIRLTKLQFMPSVSQRFHYLVITTPSLNPSTVMYNNNQSVLQSPLLSLLRCLR